MANQSPPTVGRWWLLVSFQPTFSSLFLSTGDRCDTATATCRGTPRSWIRRSTRRPTVRGSASGRCASERCLAFLFGARNWALSRFFIPQRMCVCVGVCFVQSGCFCGCEQVGCKTPFVVFVLPLPTGEHVLENIQMGPLPPFLLARFGPRIGQVISSPMIQALEAPLEAGAEGFKKTGAVGNTTRAGHTPPKSKWGCP